MTASVLRQAGLRVGMFISPYVEDFRERIQLDGQWISKEDLAEEVSTLAPLFRQLQQEDRAVTEFEFDTAMALHYFARKKCDMVVLEVGMGGKLDATNCIDAPDVSAIASISFDHTQYLGNTLAEIAGADSHYIDQPGSHHDSREYNRADRGRKSRDHQNGQPGGRLPQRAGRSHGSDL